MRRIVLRAAAGALFCCSAAAWPAWSQEYVTLTGAETEASETLEDGAAAIPTALGNNVERLPPIEDRVKSLEKKIKKLEDDAKKKKDADAKKKEEDASKPSWKLRGRIQADAGYFTQDAASRATVGDIQDGADFRRVRLGASGKAFEVTDYMIEVDFAGAGRPSMTDVYGDITELPYLNTVRIGHFKEPFSLEENTSDNDTWFLERALPINAFSPARNLGIMAFDWTKDYEFTWAYGAFRENSDDFGDDIGDARDRAATARVTWLPYYDEPTDGRYLIHFGGAYSYRDPDNAVVRYRSRPEAVIRQDGVGSTPFFVDTGNVAATEAQLAELEAAFVYGPFSMESEAFGTFVDPAAGDSLFFSGAYVQASYFLTGENKSYNRERGVFDKQKVYEPFFRVRTDSCDICTGKGAWELLARLSYLDLNDGAVHGGRVTDMTVGVNWYLNTYFRLQFNYIHSDLDNFALGDSNTNIFMTRLHLYF